METRGDEMPESQPNDQTAQQTEVYAVRLAWARTEDISVFFANQFLSQINDDVFVLSFGQVIPPPLLGTDEERREQAARIDTIEIKTLARFSLTPQRMRELIGVLQENLERYEAHVGEISPNE